MSNNFAFGGINTSLVFQTLELSSQHCAQRPLACSAPLPPQGKGKQ
jgi:hypothetical protein